MNKDKYIKQLEEENKRLRKKVKKIAILEKRIAELEEKIAGVIVNKLEASMPFKANRKSRQKRPGRRPGHWGVTRPLPNHVDEEIELKLDNCPDCGTELKKTTEIKERYVEDIRPQRNYHVKKYLIHRSWCSKCKEIKSPKPLDVIPKFRFGLYFMLFVCFQKYGLNLTINKIQKELWIYFGLRVSQGEISQTLNRTAELFGSRFEELKSKIRSAASVNIDETGWRINGVNHWVWTFISHEVALFKIDRSRGHEVPKKVLGKEYNGVITSDRYLSYNKLERKTKSTQQKCWVHILRNSSDLAEYHKEGKYIHRKLKEIYSKAKELEKLEGKKDVQELIDKIDKLAYRKFESWNCLKFVKSICIKHRDNLFRFVSNPAVESTNNRAERSLRPLVRIRKISGGNRSANGARATEVLSSVIQTCELQGIDFFKDGTDFLQNQFL